MTLREDVFQNSGYGLLSLSHLIPFPLFRMHNYKEEPFRISPSPPDQSASHQPQAYSNVTSGSMLPAELRTSDNLMGAAVPDNRAQLLLEGYQKERQQYEEVQLKQQNARQRTAGRPADVYTNPVDAIQNHVSSLPKGLKVGSSEKASPPSKFCVGTEGASAVEEYSDVFDKLPPNQAESVGRPASKSVRTTSDSRSPRYDPGYEDVGDFGSSGKDGTAPVKPSSLPSGSLGDAGKQDTKRFSGPHGGRRESSKEMVQRVDGKTRSFRLTSTGQVKKIRVDTEDSEPEDSNFNNNNVNKGTVPQTQEHVVSIEDVDAAKLKLKEAAFEIEEDQPGPDSYAMVNVTDKKQYRAEADGDKAEGSGAPRHYSVKDSPTKPVAESTPV